MDLVRRRQLVFSLLLFFFVQPLSAQHGGAISGKVVDAVSLQPLPLVNAVLRDTRYGVATDSNGYFEIRGIPAGEYILEVSHIGYKRKYRVIALSEDENIAFDLSLEQDAIRLPEVTVTDTVRLDRLSHLSTGSLHITRAMLLDAKTKNVTDALRVVAPRFDFTTTRQRERIRTRNPSSVPLVLRNILILIEGQRIYPSGEDVYNDPYWLDKYIGIHEIESITLHKGDNAWVRAGRRGERLDWLIEITRRK